MRGQERSELDDRHLVPARCRHGSSHVAHVVKVGADGLTRLCSGILGRPSLGVDGWKIGNVNEPHAGGRVLVQQDRVAVLHHGQYRSSNAVQSIPASRHVAFSADSDTSLWPSAITTVVPF